MEFLPNRIPVLPLKEVAILMYEIRQNIDGFSITRSYSDDAPMGSSRFFEVPRCGVYIVEPDGSTLGELEMHSMSLEVVTNEL
jgi:hypothetical protein